MFQKYKFADASIVAPNDTVIVMWETTKIEFTSGNNLFWRNSEAGCWNNNFVTVELGSKLVNGLFGWWVLSPLAGKCLQSAGVYNVVVKVYIPVIQLDLDFVCCKDMVCFDQKKAY